MKISKKISIMDDIQEKYSLPLQKNEYLRQEYQNRQIHVFFASEQFFTVLSVLNMIKSKS